MSVVPSVGCRYSAWRDTQQVGESAGRGGCRRHSGVLRRAPVRSRLRPRCPRRRPPAQDITHGPFFPQCGGISDETIIEQTRVPGLVNTATNSVGCQWLAGGSILGPHFSFTWYRGSPIGRERKTEELSRTSVEDINIEGHDGFIALDEDPTLGVQPVRDRHPVRRRLHRVVDQLLAEAVPRRVRRRQGTHPPVDCELQMTRPPPRTSGPPPRLWSVSSMLSGCTQTVEGTAAKSGTGDVPRNNDSQKQYPNLLKECEVLTEDILAKTVGADPLDIQSTFVGAVCRWQAANPAGLDRHHPLLVRAGQPGQRAQDRRAAGVPDREIGRSPVFSRS